MFRTFDVATISSSVSAGSIAQAGFQQLRVQEARRSADHAEQIARSLAAQARNAQRVADRADENARSLTVRSDQARADAGAARQGVAYLDSVGRMQQQLGEFVGRIAEREAVAPVAEAPAEAPVSSAVVNTQGQVTGTLVNTSA